MALPRAVQAELDASAAIEAQLNGAGEPQPVAAEAAVETAGQVTPPEHAAPTVNWEQKFRTVEGMIEAQARQHSAAMKELQHRLDESERALVEYRNQAQVTPEPISVVTDEDKEAFGEDLIALQERIAESKIAKVLNEVNQLKSQLGKTEEITQRSAEQAARLAEEKYFDRLAGNVADWEKINTDTRWLEWLNGRFPGSKVTRQQQLNEARVSLDLDGTIELFNAFKETLGVANQPTIHPGLASQFAPSKTRASSAPVANQTDTRIWSQQEVAAALDPRKLSRMTAAEVERVMNEIDAAAASNRIR